MASRSERLQTGSSDFFRTVTFVEIKLTSDFVRWFFQPAPMVHTALIGGGASSEPLHKFLKLSFVNHIFQPEYELGFDVQLL